MAGTSIGSKLLGKMEAVLELLERQSKQIKQDAEALQSSAGYFNRALTILHEFGDKIDPLFDWVKEHERVEWITTNELAAELKVTRQTIWNWYRSGVITGYQLGSYSEIRFDRKEVVEEIKEKGRRENRGE